MHPHLHYVTLEWPLSGELRKINIMDRKHTQHRSIPMKGVLQVASSNIYIYIYGTFLEGNGTKVPDIIKGKMEGKDHKTDLNKHR